VTTAGDDEHNSPRFADRLRRALLRPDAANVGAPAAAADRAGTNERARMVGLVAAPLAAAIAFAVTAALVSGDPASKLADGDPNRLHVPVSRYQEALVALLVLAVVMLVMSLLRRRLFVGIAMALYGLTLFNLHYYGFAIPFLVGGAWFLVHAYREHTSSLDAGSGVPGEPDHRASPRRRTKANRRYTPPTTRPGN
jgi:hypothetical protein